MSDGGPCRLVLVIAALSALLQGCPTLRVAVDPALMSIDDSRLPRTDIAASIPGLGPCTDNPDRTLRLNSGHPVTVLVHGCYGSSGQFRGLAQVLAFHGQQTACFTYDDRAALDVSAAELGASLDQLLKLIAPSPAPPVTIIGHSQGALVARRALTIGQPYLIGRGDTPLELVTVSGPFAGIAAADACGSPVVRALSLGLIGPMCRLGTGDKWADITYSSSFIRNPGTLSKQVARHLKLDTDERGSCRRVLDGRCVEDDLTFTLDEQRNPAVDRDAAATLVEVKAGHVEIVGDDRVAPVKLIAVLQQNGIIRPTEPQRVAAFNRLLWDVYRDPTIAPSAAAACGSRPPGARSIAPPCGTAPADVGGPDDRRGQSLDKPVLQQPSIALRFTWKPDWPAVSQLLPKIEEALAPQRQSRETR